MRANKIASSRELELIAEFMEARVTLQFTSTLVAKFPDGKSYRVRDLKYAKRWDWIVPACKKALAGHYLSHETREPRENLSIAISKLDLDLVFLRLITLIETINETKKKIKTMSPAEKSIYIREAMIREAKNRRLFYAVTGRTYLEQLNVWRALYDARPRKLNFDEFLQRRLAFIRRVAL